MPRIIPISFLTVIFSLNKNIEPKQTKIIPRPLNNGNKTTDGTLPARRVITVLIIHRDNALPIANGYTALALDFDSMCGFEMTTKIKNATTNE